MQRHLANYDEGQSVPLNANSWFSGFLNRPKSSWGNITTATRIYPFATELQHNFNSSPDRAKLDVLGMILGVFWPIQATLVVEEPLCDVGTANSDHVCGGGAALWCSNPLLSGHLIKTEWLVANLTPIGSPNRAECDILGMMFFLPIQAVFWTGSRFAM